MYVYDNNKVICVNVLMNKGVIILRIKIMYIDFWW